MTGVMMVCRWIVAVVLLASFCVHAGRADSKCGPESFASLRQAITDLRRSSGDQYPNAQDYLTRLSDIESRWSAADDAEKPQVQRAWVALRRQALMANPLLQHRTILFVVRPQYWGNHGPINTMFQNGELQAGNFRGGSRLRTLRLASDGRIAEARTLLDVPDGIVRDPEVSWDGSQIVFAMRRNPSDDYHIYQMELDWTQPVQLTFGSESSDVEPAYLADGRLLINSTRDLKFCHCNRHPMGNLFVMSSDGTNILQIGGNNLWEGHPSLLPDGRILYSRWEYVDRQFGPSFGLWTCNPDGTGHALYYGNNAWAPGSILDARGIPDTETVVCIFGACHDLPWGAMAIVDRRRGLDGSDPVLKIWPAWTRKWLENQQNAQWHPQHIDAFRETRPKYEDPWPLSDKYFLVSRTVSEDTGQTMQMGIFLVDVFGNELLLHTEQPGCYDPMPVATRPCPPAVPAQTDFSRQDGAFYVRDVYQGSGMEFVPQGEIKYLRIIEAPPKRAWTPAGGGGIDADQAPLMNWNLVNNKRIIGDVPVETDGSAYFSVPANTYVYFQALDASKMMVQSMRSGTFLQPGETVGCVGCHENRQAAPPFRPAVAWSRPISIPQPWYGSAREFNYLTEIQPIFDKHCVRCHDFGEAAGSILNLAGDLGVLFNMSYLELHRRSAVRWFPDQPDAPKLLIKAVHDGPPAVLPAYAWGSHRSRLIDIVREGHEDVTLSDEELARLITWIDLNAPYYGSYSSVFPDHPYGRSPLDNKQLGRLAELTGRAVNDFKHDPHLQISFTRPQLSPLLAQFQSQDSYEHREALQIILAGKRLLKDLPREDLLGPDAQPRTAADVNRLNRYLKYASSQAKTRQALQQQKEPQLRP